MNMTLRLCLKLSCDSYMTRKRSNDLCLYSQQCVLPRDGHTAGTNPSQYVTEVRITAGIASTESTDFHTVDSLDTMAGRGTSIPPPLPRRPTDRSLSEHIAYVSHCGDGCFSSSESDRIIFYHIYLQLQVSRPR